MTWFRTKPSWMGFLLLQGNLAQCEDLCITWVRVKIWTALFYLRPRIKQHHLWNLEEIMNTSFFFQSSLGFFLINLRGFSFNILCHLLLVSNFKPAGFWVSYTFYDSILHAIKLRLYSRFHKAEIYRWKPLNSNYKLPLPKKEHCLYIYTYIYISEKIF